MCSEARGRWLALLALALLLPLLLGLGFWQLERAAQKRALQALAGERAAQPAIDLAALAGLADPQLRRVWLHGHFDAAHSLLLDNRLRDGRPGVELLQPFLDHASGRWVLVNRGWLAWPDRREMPRFTTPAGELRLLAQVYRMPGQPLRLGALPAGGDFPRLVTAVDAAALWRELGRAGLADELRLLDGPGRQRGDWPLLNMTPHKHLGYAVQWFALAATLLGLALWRLWPRRKEAHA